MQIQAKEVKKEEEEKEKEEEKEEKQNQTSDQGLDGVYPWLQKLNETRTHFNILLSRVKGPWLSTLKSHESMLSNEKYIFLCKNSFLLLRWRLGWKGCLLVVQCASYFYRCSAPGRISQILLKSSSRQWHRGTLKTRWSSLEHFQLVREITFIFNLWERTF